MIKLKIWGNIGERTSYVVEQAITSIKDETEPIVIVINSIGGNLNDAIAIANLLKSVSNPIITIAMGSCLSAAAMIFSCGEHRYVGDDICYMIHQPYTPYGITNLNYSKTIESSKMYKRDLDIYIKYITNGTHIPSEKLKLVTTEGKNLYLTAKDCLKYKIATNRFTSWKALYRKEKIDAENISSYEILDEPEYLESDDEEENI